MRILRKVQNKTYGSFDVLSSNRLFVQTASIININEFAQIEIFYHIVYFFVLDNCAVNLKSCSERRNMLEVARTAKSCSKCQKLLKSCQAQSDRPTHQSPVLYCSPFASKSQVSRLHQIPYTLPVVKSQPQLR